MMLRRPFLALLALALSLGFVPWPSAQAQQVTFTYSVATRGDVQADVGEFARQSQQTLSDRMGWTLGGSVSFAPVSEGGDFTLWLASPAAMETFSPVCAAEFSCRVGNDVVINDENWRDATPEWPRGLRAYRHMVVNHEIGHWLGLDHVECPGVGELAPLMMQQSKGLNGCVANPWPTDEEKDNAASRLGVPVLIPETVAFAPAAGDEGYWLLESDGSVLTFSTSDFGDFGPLTPLSDLTATPDGRGYWIVDEQGGVFTFGNASFHGSVPGVRQGGVDVPHVRFVAITPTPDGGGYWILDEHGGVFTFGNAEFHGSVPGLEGVPDIDAVDIAATPDGGGYWVADDVGGVFTFGNASFHGSVPGVEGIPEVDAVALSATPDGGGYWVADDVGGVFTFGNAPFHGSVPGSGASSATATDFERTTSGEGYWVMDVRGNVFTFGDAPFHGSGA